MASPGKDTASSNLNNEAENSTDDETEVFETFTKKPTKTPVYTLPRRIFSSNPTKLILTEEDILRLQTDKLLVKTTSNGEVVRLVYEGSNALPALLATEENETTEENGTLGDDEGVEGLGGVEEVEDLGEKPSTSTPGSGKRRLTKITPIRKRLVGTSREDSEVPSSPKNVDFVEVLYKSGNETKIFLICNKCGYVYASKNTLQNKHNQGNYNTCNNNQKRNLSQNKPAKLLILKSFINKKLGDSQWTLVDGQIAEAELDPSQSPFVFKQ